MSNDTLLQQDLSSLIGLDTLPEDEKLSMVRDLGEIVMEAALLRLAESLTGEQAQALEVLTETMTDPAMLHQHLIDHYPQFEQILQEEITAFRKEAEEIFG